MRDLHGHRHTATVAGEFGGERVAERRQLVNRLALGVDRLASDFRVRTYCQAGPQPLPWSLQKRCLRLAPDAHRFGQKGES